MPASRRPSRGGPPTSKMFAPELFPFRTFAVLIEVVGSIIILGYVLGALWQLLGRDVTRARLLIADGVIAGLNFKVAAALLKLAGVLTWNQIGLFVVTLALRTVLKRVFSWERGRLEKDLPKRTSPL